MCREASFVLTKSSSFWSQVSDSHEEIIEENSLQEGPNPKLNPYLLRVECIPVGGDFRIPVEDWVFSYDQDILPEWADQERDEKRTKKAAALWLASKVVLPNETRNVQHNQYVYAVYGIVRNVWNNGVVQNVCDNGVVQNVWGKGTVRSHTSSCSPEMFGSFAVFIDASGSKVKITVGH